MGNLYLLFLHIIFTSNLKIDKKKFWLSFFLIFLTSWIVLRTTKKSTKTHLFWKLLFHISFTSTIYHCILLFLFLIIITTIIYIISFLFHILNNNFFFFFVDIVILKKIK